MELIEIKHRLLDQGITIQDIADRAGVSRTLVSLILKGERKGQHKKHQRQLKKNQLIN